MVKKVIKRKDDKLYVKWKDYDFFEQLDWQKRYYYIKMILLYKILFSSL